MASKRYIAQQTAKVSKYTLISRMFALVREVLITQFLGANASSDAFFTAFKIPNALRKIFAEGALSAAFIPTAVQIVHVKGKEGIHSLMTLMFLVFEGIVILLCGLTMLYAEQIIWFIAGGFSHEQVLQAVPWLRILVPFVLCISSAALLTGPLQSVGNFFVPAFAPIILNVVFITGLLICMHFKLSTTALCWFILLGGFCQFLWHLYAYLSTPFLFGNLRREDIPVLLTVGKKFLQSLVGSSIEEINLFVSTSFASYLARGSLSILRYANQFINIPLGVFVTAFSTVLLPHFSRVSIYAPKRLSFYLLEAAKVILWIILPVIFLMGFFSEKIFLTIFVSEKFTEQNALSTALILRILLISLACASLNKIMRSIYYSLHETRVPGIVALVATTVDASLSWYLLYRLQLVGLAIAMATSSVVQTVLFAVILHYWFGITVYIRPLLAFLFRYGIQLCISIIGFILVYYTIVYTISRYLTEWEHLLMNTALFWSWAMPLSALFAATLYLLRGTFGIRLYFVD